MRATRRAWHLVAALVLGTGLMHCGYAVIGTRSPFGLERIALVAFAEDESVGLGPVLASALARELATEGVTLVPFDRDASGTLSGTILAEQTVKSPVAGVGAHIPAYQITLRIRAVLSDKAGKTLWSTEVSLNDSFLPAGSEASPTTKTAETEANRRRALQRIAERAARMIHECLVVDSALGPQRAS